MAPIKHAGLHILLLGLFLHSALVSGQVTSLAPSSSSMAASSTSAAISATSAAASATSMAAATSTTGTSTTSSGNNVVPTTQSSLTSTSGMALQTSSSAVSVTTTTSAPTPMMQAGTTAQPTISTTSGGSAMMSQSNTMASSSFMTSGSGSSTTKTPSYSNSTDIINGTTMSNETSMNMTQIYCPSFNCSYFECYSMYSSQNETLCDPGDCCQLFKSMDMWYTASCTPTCADTCVSTSQANCSVNCCNSTGCLNETFASMMMTTTVDAPTTMAPEPPSTTTATPTTVNNGNKCHKGTCAGEKCYTDFKDSETCTSSQPHCQLKKESDSSGLKYTAGCTNCAAHTACKGSTQPPCHLECCNATMTSCLRLNGTLNVPSFATRGPYAHTEWMASLLCLLAITLLA